MKKNIFHLLILLVIFCPAIAKAQIDTRCWTESECTAKRKAMILELGNNIQDTAKAADGFVSDNETRSVCGEFDNTGKNKMGFCLPASRTVTEISFGGRNDFLNLGDFIQYIYRYAIIVAGILATIMIIISGFQWAASAGGDGISAAKQRIGNAVIGLAIAVGSYAILNLINPYLVNLRLPQVWLVNSQNELPQTCNTVQPGTKLAVARQQYEPTSPTELESRYNSAQQNGQFTFTNETTACGTEYFVEKGGTQTCLGTVCPNTPGGYHTMCMPQIDSTLPSKCLTGHVGGRIYNSSVTTGMTAADDTWIISATAGALTGNSFWAWPWTNKISSEEPRLFLVCADGFSTAANAGVIINPKTAKTATDYSQLYTIYLAESASINTFISNQCGQHQGARGFVLYIDMNKPNNLTSDETHVLGKNGTTAIDLGDDTAFAKTALTAPGTYFIQPDELTTGVQLNIDAGQITKIDDNNQNRAAAYTYLGYK